MITVQEVMKRARERCDQPRPIFIDSHSDWNKIDKSTVTAVFISSSYEGNIPNLTMFPGLREFSCSKEVDSAFVSQQDWSNMESVYLNIVCGPETITFHAPMLNSLEIRIEDNRDTQTSLFDKEPGTIDLRGLDQLQSLRIKNCVGYTFLLSPRYPYMQNFVAAKCDFEPSQFAKVFPNLRLLTMHSCDLTNLNFIDHFENLEALDLSRNNITEIQPLLKCSKLKRANLYGNGINNTQGDLLRQRSYDELIITDKDNMIRQFRSSIQFESNMAYTKVKIARKEDPKRNRIYQTILDSKTDEELFLRYLGENIAHLMQKSAESNGNGPMKISKAEQLQLVAEQYPFLDLSSCLS